MIRKNILYTLHVKENKNERIQSINTKRQMV